LESAYGNRIDPDQSRRRATCPAKNPETIGSEGLSVAFAQLKLDLPQGGVTLPPGKVN
jgi:hypothetical protein